MSMTIDQDGKSFEEREREMAAQDEVLKPKIAKWYEARPKSVSELSELLYDILNVKHTYSSIVDACAAAALAATRTINADADHGGVTGFQAGFVMWQFVKHWMHLDSPLRLVDYRDMLYPQKGEKFEKVISADTFKWLQETAKEKLAGIAPDEDINPDVKAHWQAIVDGTVPFGYKINDDL